MPSLRSRCLVRLVWLLRAWALRACVYWISWEPCSRSWLVAASSSHHDRTRADTAVCTWHTVSSGFFPPQVRMNFGQEEVAYGTEDPVPFQAHVFSPFVMVQTDFPFAILEAPLDAPA